MEKRLERLRVIYRRRRAEPPRAQAPIDWRAVPAELPECFAALTATEQVEWGELLAAYHAPGAWQQLRNDDAFFRKLAALDARVDWDGPLPVQRT